MSEWKPSDEWALRMRAVNLCMVVLIFFALTILSALRATAADLPGEMRFNFMRVPLHYPSKDFPQRSQPAGLAVPRPRPYIKV